MKNRDQLTPSKWEIEQQQSLLITGTSVSSWFCCFAPENVFELGEMAEKTLPDIDQKP